MKSLLAGFTLLFSYQLFWSYITHLFTCLGFLIVHVSVQIDGILSIYMEYMSESSIHKLLQKNGPFNEYAIRRCTAQILSGLAYLHGRKIAHR